jgi:drug/metabolite transporter (DMT)-like permease
VNHWEVATHAVAVPAEKRIKGKTRVTEFSIGPFVLIIIAASGALISQLLMKQGLNQGGPIIMGSMAQVVGLIERVLTTPLLLAGYILSFLNGLVWLAILSRVNLSYAAPLMTAIYFVLLLLTSSLLLREVVTPGQWLGTLLIITGIFLISRFS